MVNTDQFVTRLETILDYYGLSASAFADKIGVQRSSLSHLLSGRNKPSLDFVLKVIDVFPEVDLYWILNGKGSFPKSENSSSTPVINTEAKSTNQSQNLFSVDDFANKNNEAEISTELEKTIITSDLLPIDTNSSIKKIVIFYENGTFEDFIPKK